MISKHCAVPISAEQGNSANPVKTRVLDTPEAAKYCGSAASTFEKLRLTGGGPSFIRITRKRVG
jgi:hypothetical protein